MRNLLIVGAVAVGLAAPAAAVPVQFAGNGHYYEHISSAVLWSQAKSAAESQTLTVGGVTYTGHLATVTSEAENNFLLSLNNDGWLGGSDAASEGTWRWEGGPETGQTFWSGGPGGSAAGTDTGYANWISGVEPNGGTGENYVHLNGGGWNDAQSSSFTRTYFVEFSVPASAAVPLPATLPLFLGVLALGAGLARPRARG